MTVPTQQRLSTLSMREARRVFSGLSAPQPGDLVGRWDGTMVGSPALRRLSRVIAACTPLRGWCGSLTTHARPDPRSSGCGARCAGWSRAGKSSACCSSPSADG